MGLFEKKNCDICGEKIGLLGNKKLDDGNLCKECASKLSPFFSDRRHSTVAQIREQLEYREANKEQVAEFVPSRTYGKDFKIYIDDRAGKFIATRSSKWKDANPDVISLAAITGVNIDVNESKTELKQDGPDNKKVSYNPPRYSYSYSIYVKILVNHPYFDDINFCVEDDIDIETIGNRPVNPEFNVNYRNGMAAAQEIKDALTGVEAHPAAAAKAVVCPHCRATTVPDAQGRCEYCGGAVY